MGVPYSREVRTAVELASALKGHATIAIYAVALVSAIQTLLLSFFLVAFIALLITVNPDLAEERKAFVSPVVRWILLPVRGWRAVTGRRPETSGREHRRVEWIENDNGSAAEGSRGTRRRNAL